MYKGTKLLIVGIILLIVGVSLLIPDNNNNGFDQLFEFVIGISFLLAALVALVSGSSINSSGAKRIEREKEEQAQRSLAEKKMREEIKQEILSELKNKKE